MEHSISRRDLPKSKRNRFLGLFFSLFVLFAVFFTACILFLSVGIADAIKALLMQYFGILLPGAALNLLLYRKRQRQLEFVAISYALGYSSTLVCYLLFIPWGDKRAPLMS